MTIYRAALFAASVLVLLPSIAWSDEVGLLIPFNPSETARASEVNDNFEAVKTAVDDNNARIVILEDDLGTPGPQGEQGAQGLDGLEGLTGPPGEQGPAGTDLAAEITELEVQLADLQAQVTFFQTYLDSLCGNGVVEPGIEGCDDGNTTDDGNGCTASCQATNVCGNGIIESGVETCDDGGTANGDGCSDSCSIEPGSFCNGEPSVCGGRVVNVCGDYCEALNSESCGGIPDAIGICVDECIQNIEDAEEIDSKACADAQLTTFECITDQDCEDILAFLDLTVRDLDTQVVCRDEILAAVDLCPNSIDLPQF
jgi:cysteine-rich repeat protein